MKSCICTQARVNGSYSLLGLAYFKIKGRRINNLLVFDLTLLFSPNLQILCIALVTEMIFKFGEGKIRRSKAVSYLYGIPKPLPGRMLSRLRILERRNSWR
jgi:hypothetical protein